MKREQEDDEIEMLLKEIPRVTSLPQLHHHHQQQEHHHLHNGYVHVHGSSPRKTILGMWDDDRSCHVQTSSSVSPISGEGSTSSSISMDGSPPPLPFFKDQIPASKKTHYLNGFWMSKEVELPDSPVKKNVYGGLTHELGLSDKLLGMRIRDEEEGSMKFDRWAPYRHFVNPYGIEFDDLPPNHGNVVMDSPLEDCRNGFCNDYGGLQCSGLSNSAVIDVERRLSMLGLLHLQNMGNLSESCLSSLQLSTPFLYRGNCRDTMNFQWTQALEHPSDEELSDLQLQTQAAFGRNCDHRGIQVPNTSHSINRAPIADEFFHSQQIGRDSNGDRREINSLSSSHMIAPNLPSGIGNLPNFSLQMFNNRIGATPNGWAPQSPPVTRVERNIEAFGCEDSLIIQGKDLDFMTNDDRYKLLRERKRCSWNDLGRGNSSEKDFELDEIGRSPRMHCPSLLPPKYNSLQKIEGYIYFIAKDHHGCRFLQQKFDEGTPEDVEMIFNDIIDRVVELMIDQYGNYLIQKLLDVCTEEQRMQILLVITEEPSQFVKISLNTHGTRAVQKLIETLKTKEQIFLAVSALELVFLDLIQDLNGSHVIQRCLQCFSNEDNKFIFYAAAKYCVDIATHRHGCCVLQHCITHSTGEHRENLVEKISSNGLILAQDAFGNYVVQYILELKIPLAILNLISQFEGNYVYLSTQKFSSNVVEKCLNVFGEESRSKIIYELLATSQFEQLLQHPFANYVIQSALVVSKGPLHASLVEAIRPFAAVLRTNPHCKRIFSRGLLKK